MSWAIVAEDLTVQGQSDAECPRAIEHELSRDQSESDGERREHTA